MTLSVDSNVRSRATSKSIVELGSLLFCSFILAATSFSQSTTWTGAISNSWLTAGNWNNGLPSATKDAVIPVTATSPVVNGAGAICRNLSLAASTSLTLSSDLACAVSATVDGTISGAARLRMTGAGSLAATTVIPSLEIAGTGQINVAGGTTVTTLLVTSGTIAPVFNVTMHVLGNATFTGGTLNNLGGAATIDVDGNVTFNGATFTNGCSMTCGGNWTANALFDPQNSSTVTFDGAGPQTVAGALFDNVVVSGPSVSFTQALDVDGAMTIGSGGGAAFGAATHRIGGAFNSTGSFTATGLFIFDGTPTAPINSTTALPSVEVAKSAGSNANFTSATINGSLTLTSGTLLPSFAQTIVVNGPAAFNGGVLSTGGGGAVIDVNGSVVFAGTQATAPCNVRCSGNWTSNASYAPTNGGLALLDGAAMQALSASSLGALTVAAGSTVTTSSTLALTASLQVAGSLTFSGSPTLDVDLDVTIDPTGTITFGTTNVTVGRSFTANGTFTTSPTATFTFDSMQTGTVNATSSFPNVVLNKPSIFADLNTNGTVSGTFMLIAGNLRPLFNSTWHVIGNATFSGGSVLGGGGSSLLDVDGNMVFNGATVSTPPNMSCGGNFTADSAFQPVNASTVFFDGASPRTASSPRFASINLAGSTVTFTTAFDLDNDMTVNLGATAALGSLTHRIGGSLNVAGGLTSTGTIIFDGVNNSTVTSVAAILPSLRVEKTSVFAGAFFNDVTMNGTLTLISGIVAPNFQKTLTVNGNAVFSGGTVQGGSATIDVNGNVTFNGATSPAPAAIRCSGNWTSDAAFAPVTTTFQTLDGIGPHTISAVNLGSLEIAQGNQVTASAPIHCGASLLVKGSFSTTSTLDIDQDVTIDPTGVVSFGAAGITVGRSFNCTGSFTAAPNAVFTFDSTVACAVTSTSTFPNVVVNKPSPFADFIGSGVIGGTFSFQAGNLGVVFTQTLRVVGASTFSGGVMLGFAGNSLLDLDGSATFNGMTVATAGPISCAGNWTADANWNPMNSSVVTFDGSMPQSISCVRFQGVVVSGSNVTFTLPLDVDRDFSTQVGSSASFGALTHHFAQHFTALGSITASGVFYFDSNTNSTISSLSPLPSVTADKSVLSTLTVLDGATVSGNLLLLNGTLSPSFNKVSTVNGNATFSGGTMTFLGGASVLDINGNVVFNGANVTAPCPIRCAGNWTTDAGFAPTNNLPVELDGIAASTLTSTAPSGTLRFDGLVVKNGIRRPSANLILDCDTIAIDAGGTLATGARRLTFPTGTFGLNGELRAEAGGTIALRATTSVTINATGTLRAIGTTVSPAVVAGEMGGGYALTVNGTLAARNFVFREMGPAGIVVAQNALIAPFPDDLRAGTFDVPSFLGGSVLLDIRRNAPVDLRYIQFNNSNASPNAKNVRTLAGAVVTFTNWTGGFAGPAFEDDPSNLITWAPPQSTQLAAFTVIGAAERTVIEFATVTEVDVQSFLVERALAPTGPFSNFMSFTAQGNGSHYSTVDEPQVPGQTYYYRLSEVLTHGAQNLLASAQATPFSAATPNILDVGPSAPHATIQSAINAATLPDTVIRVAAGNYPAFTIGATAPTSMRIVAPALGVTISTVSGPVRIENRTVDQVVQIEGFAIGELTTSHQAALVTNSDATVLISQCVLQGGVSRPGLHLVDSRSVVTQDCILIGGTTGGLLETNSELQCTGLGSLGFDVRTGSDLVTCDVLVGGFTGDGSGTTTLVPGLRPTVALPGQTRLADTFTVNLQTLPSSFWILGVSLRLRRFDLTSPFIELTGLIDPIDAPLIVATDVSDPAGLSQLTYRLPGFQPLLGATLVFQMLAYDPSSGTYRFSNAGTMTCIP